MIIEKVIELFEKNEFKTVRVYFRDSEQTLYYFEVQVKKKAFLNKPWFNNYIETLAEGKLQTFKNLRK